MNQSEQINELSKALSNAQKMMKGAKKNKTSNFHDYADINSVLQACKIHLADNELSIMQPLGMIDGKMVLYTQLTHSSGQWTRSCCFVEGETPGGRLKGVQATGSALSYMKRYSLCSLIGLEVGDEDDDGDAAVVSSEKNKVQEKLSVPITKEKSKELQGLLEECEPAYQSNFWSYLRKKVKGLQSLEQLPADMYEQVKSGLLKKREEFNSEEETIAYG